MNSLLLGVAISSIRQERHLSQKKLAEKANLSRNAIINYENGKRSPSIDVLSKIANALDVPVDFILNFDYENVGKDFVLVEHGLEIKTIIDNTFKSLYQLYQIVDPSQSEEDFQKFIKGWTRDEIKKITDTNISLLLEIFESRLSETFDINKCPVTYKPYKKNDKLIINLKSNFDQLIDESFKLKKKYIPSFEKSLSDYKSDLSYENLEKEHKLFEKKISSLIDKNDDSID